MIFCESENVDNFNLDPKQIYFIPLGGSEQFGVNLNLYAHDGKWLAIDCGIGFADHRFPGVDILLPDPTFIEARRDDLAGLIVTHAHEDHVGAVPYLWPRLRCPIYCTEFTAAVLRKKFSEVPECRTARIHVVKAGDVIDLPPFKARFIHVAHSIPDTCSIVLETPVGKIVHSGDWNLDPRPVLGGVTDEDSFKQAGNDNILAYVGDSTNAEAPGRAGSESDVEKGLEEVFRECRGRIAVTIFASNIARMRSIAKAARASKRHVGLIGRSLHTMASSARDCGFLEGIPSFLPPEDLETLPSERQVLIVTGSQGESRAALARMARGEHPAHNFRPGDTVIFSARPIPGNETEINLVKNNLVGSGVKVITPRDTAHCIHVSGHPCRDEIVDMYRWVRPKLVVPVHGERTQLEAQAALARDCQVPHVLVPNNGSVVCLGPGQPEIVDHVGVGLLAVEPKRILDAGHQAIAARRKLQYTGAVHVTLIMDGRGDLARDPYVTTVGLIDPENEAEKAHEENIINEIEDILADMEREDLQDDHAVHEEIRIGIRHFVQAVLGIKPKTTVHIVRV